MRTSGSRRSTGAAPGPVRTRIVSPIVSIVAAGTAVPEVGRSPHATENPQEAISRAVNDRGVIPDDECARRGGVRSRLKRKPWRPSSKPNGAALSPASSQQRLRPLATSKVHAALIDSTTAPSGRSPTRWPRRARDVPRGVYERTDGSSRTPLPSRIAHMALPGRALVISITVGDLVIAAGGSIVKIRID